MKLPQITPTIIDRVVAWASPEAGLSRLRARTQMAIAGAWTGGATNRLQTNNWLPYNGSADTDMLVDRRWLRSRSRDLQRNNPLARGAINTVVTSSVGTGLSLRAQIDSKILGFTADQAEEWQDTVEREHRLWAENPRECDAEATLDFYGLQSLAFRSALESGDVFSLLPMFARPATIYQTRVQLIEADRVTNADMRPDTEMLFGGVERDSYGAPVGYQILKQHPGGLISPNTFEWMKVPAFGTKTGRRNVVHLFDKLRPGQPRGVPYLSPVIEALKQLGDYTDGEVRAAVVSSLFTVFVKSDTGLGLGLDGNGDAPAQEPVSGDTMKLGAGAIVDLAPGDDVSFANPGRPSTSFDPFVQAVLRQIGVALEIPFEILIKHFTSSYSASRAALLEAWRFFRGRRAWLGAMFCSPVYEAWLDEAVALGRIQADGYFEDPVRRAAFRRASWIGDSPGQIDPLKEVDAAERRLGLLLSTYADETTALSGQDWEDVVERREREEAMIEKRNLRAVLTDAKGVPVDPQGVVPDAGVPALGGKPATPGRVPQKAGRVYPSDPDSVE